MFGTKPRLFPYVLSQYTWLIGVLLVCAIPILIPDKNHVVEVKSATRTFNAALDPQLFATSTDVHVEEMESRQTQDFIKALDFAASLSVDTFFVDGDLVQNWDRGALGKVATQRKEQFEVYKRVVDEHAKAFKYYFDVAGNHDLFDVWAYDSPRHYYRQFSASLRTLPDYENMSVFHVHSYETEQFVFVCVNPFFFPMTRANVDFWARADDAMLDKFEAELARFEGREVFIFTHFPVHWWLYYRGSAKCKRFKEILDRCNAHLVFTGHKHPESMVPQHHGTMLEILASDILIHSKMGVITLDNGCAVFHELCVNEEYPTGFVTNPVPYEQISKKSVFNEEDLNIRVILRTTDQRVNTTVYIDGVEVGQLGFDRMIKENVSLWSLRKTVGQGTHTLRFSGFFEKEMEFLIGSVRESYTEGTYKMDYVFRTSKIVGIFVWIVLIALLFPYEIPQVRAMTGDVKKWLKGLSDEPHWLAVTLGSPWIVRSHLAELPLLLRVLIFVGCISPLVLPSVFFTIEGHVGFMNVYGFYITSLRYDIWGLMTPFVYHLFVTIPSALLGSAIGFSFPWNHIVILDIIWAIAGTVGSFLFANIYVIQMSDLVRANLSIFTISPLVIHGTLLIWRALTKRQSHYHSISSEPFNISA